jgi:hypothetical protein
LERSGVLIASAAATRHADARHNVVAVHIETGAPLYNQARQPDSHS